MVKLFVTLVALVLAACEPTTENLAHPSSVGDSKTTFTLSSGVQVTSTDLDEGVSNEAYTKFEVAPQFVSIAMRQYFHRRSELKRVWLSLPKNGIATLNLGTGADNSFFGSKEEVLKEVFVRIQRDRLQAVSSLAVYNTDTGENMAIQPIR